MSDEKDLFHGVYQVNKFIGYKQNLSKDNQYKCKLDNLFNNSDNYLEIDDNCVIGTLYILYNPLY